MATTPEELAAQMQDIDRGGGDRKMNVVRHSKERCSYRCPYYQDGPVLSLCNKYKKKLHYDGGIPPLLVEECKVEMTAHNA